MITWPFSALGPTCVSTQTSCSSSLAAMDASGNTQRLLPCLPMASFTVHIIEPVISGLRLTLTRRTQVTYALSHCQPARHQHIRAAAECHVNNIILSIVQARLSSMVGLGYRSTAAWQVDFLMDSLAAGSSLSRRGARQSLMSLVTARHLLDLLKSRSVWLSVFAACCNLGPWGAHPTREILTLA